MSDGCHPRWAVLGLAALLYGGAAVALEPFERKSSAGSSSASAPAATEAPDPSRETLADLLLQVDTMQNELRKLHGQVEVQANEIERLKTRQRELIADIDRRVQELERRRGVAAPTETTASGSAPASAPTVNAANAVQEQPDYDAAFGLLKQGFYERAAKGFRDFMAKYPQSNLRDNAQYWLGESYYAVLNYRQAAEEFSKIIKDHPKSPKAPEAMLKTGYSHYELGEWAKARASLNQVKAFYPGTAAAKLAEQRLAKMKKEKH